MQNKKKARILADVFALLLVAVIGFESTWAWSTHEISQENNVQSRTAEIKIQEEFPDQTVEAGKEKIKKVTVQNTGKTAAFVRVSYAEGWDKDTERLTGSSAVTKNWTVSWESDWEAGSDGWYYYKKILPSGSGVQILNGVAFPASVPQDAQYTLDFMVESVQVSTEEEVNRDAAKKLFGRTETLSQTVVENGAVTAGVVDWQ